MDFSQRSPGLVALSLNKTIKAYPAVGWVRADKVSSEATLHELNELRKEMQSFKKNWHNLKIALIIFNQKT